MDEFSTAMIHAKHFKHISYYRIVCGNLPELFNWNNLFGPQPTVNGGSALPCEEGGGEVYNEDLTESYAEDDTLETGTI